MDELFNQLDAYTSQINEATDLASLDRIYLELFGKQGIISQATEKFPTLSKEEVRDLAPKVTKIKKELEDLIGQKRQSLKEKFYQVVAQESLDLSETKIKERTGYLHPTTLFEEKIVELFKKIGFQQFEAPHIDTDDYNFGLLNIPENHPARDLWDTLYIDKSNLGNIDKDVLLRTHTSNSQIRIMRQYKAPVRMMCLGRCFRYENLDARHEHTFDQFELVYVDKGLSMAHLQYLSEYFLQSVLGKDTKVRLRPKYYPFVEPGVGIDGTCIFCKGEGCKVCGGLGWLELGGAGMIHPTVLKNGGIDPNEYSGIAWGPGLGRIMMLQNGIDDLRKLLSGDLDFIKEISSK